MEQQETPTEAAGTGAAGAPRPAKSEQTRALILETALRLFQENGYDRATMRAIAREAGVSVGNAYYYFESCGRPRTCSPNSSWSNRARIRGTRRRRDRRA